MSSIDIRARAENGVVTVTVTEEFRDRCRLCDRAMINRRAAQRYPWSLDETRHALAGVGVETEYVHPDPYGPHVCRACVRAGRLTVPCYLCNETRNMMVMALALTNYSEVPAYNGADYGYICLPCAQVKGWEVIQAMLDADESDRVDPAGWAE